MYLLSERKMEEFRHTLKSFNETLKKNKVLSRLGIPAKDPADFDIDYVLTIAVKASERNHKSDDINACRRFARQLCQRAVKPDNLLSGLISLAPTDIYGSLISGGFTIALAVSRPCFRQSQVSDLEEHFPLNWPTRLWRLMKSSALRWNNLWPEFRRS